MVGKAQNRTVIPAQAGTSQWLAKHKAATSSPRKRGTPNGWQSAKPKTSYKLKRSFPTAFLISKQQNSSMRKQPSVYIMTNRMRGTLYVGVTSALAQRVSQHKAHVVRGFTCKYQLILLVYFEHHSTMLEAIKREKAMKKWRRSWKLALIERGNPEWFDLSWTLG